MRVLIKNGLLLLEEGAFKGDLLTEGSRIAYIGPACNEKADKVIDASGCLVFPGFIDTHTHFDLDLGVTVTADDFTSGTKAALVGGTTTVLDFATQDRGMTMQEAFDRWMKKAAHSSCNYGFHMALSEWNKERIAEIDKMIDQGVTSFKMYMVYDNMRLSDGDMYEAVKLLAKRDCIVGVHCENDDIIKARIKELKAEGKLSPRYHPVSRPNLVEADGISRLMDITALAKAPAWVVHLSTKEGLETARRARERGQEVYLETCPQYLVLEEKNYQESDGDKYVMSPPLRSKEDQQALLQGMKAGEIDWVGTDHCSFTMAQKALGKNDFSRIPNGGAGVQNRAEIVFTRALSEGYIDFNQMRELLSTRAAKLFGMYPKKGVLAVGADADIAVFDPKAPHEISYKTNLHRCDNSPYEGYRALGKTRDVVLGGRVAVENGELKVEGLGEYVHRSPCERYRK